MTEAIINHQPENGAIKKPESNGQKPQVGASEKVNGNGVNRTGVTLNDFRVPTVDIPAQMNGNHAESNGIKPTETHHKESEVRPEGTPAEPLIIDGAICERVDVVPGVVTAIRVENLMPDYYKSLIEGAMLKDGDRATFQGGEVDTSLADPEFTTKYIVMDGTKIESRIPFLDRFWKRQGLEIVEKITRKDMKIDIEKDKLGRGYGNNVNMIPNPRKTAPGEKEGDGYELHTDFNTDTLLISLTTINEGDGGELQLQLQDGSMASVRVVEGWAYHFNGKEHPHAVTKLTKEGPEYRTTVPMNYVPTNWTEKRTDISAIFKGKGKEVVEEQTVASDNNVIDFPTPTPEPPTPSTPTPRRRNRAS